VTPLVETFIELARRYSIAVRHSDRMAAQGSRDQMDDALAGKQEIEAQVEEHMMLLKRPEWLRSR
jgi:hypothetical protein